MSDADKIHAEVSDYYSREITCTSDLKTSACCTATETTATVKKLLANLHDDVLSKFYGCGSPLPEALSGMTVLDLGCGTGRDVYVAAQLVGPCGKVIGVDMTDEQLEVAERLEDWHAKKFGFSKPNTIFVKGHIEDLKRCGIQDNSVDVVISNCVVNLASDKEKVLREVWRILKPGGELYFSDIYTDRRVPEAAQKDKTLWGECLSGALYRGDFASIMRRVGFSTYWTGVLRWLLPPHLVQTTTREVAVTDPKFLTVLGGTHFFSDTIRAFKIVKSDDAPEDYGETAAYLGSLPESPHFFPFSLDHVFITGVQQPVSGNVAAALRESRFRSHFRISARGDHRGRFVDPRFLSGLAQLGVQPNLTAMVPSGDADVPGGSCCAPGGGKCC